MQLYSYLHKNILYITISNYFLILYLEITPQRNLFIWHQTQNKDHVYMYCYATQSAILIKQQHYFAFILNSKSKFYFFTVYFNGGIPGRSNAP